MPQLTSRQIVDAGSAPDTVMLRNIRGVGKGTINALKTAGFDVDQYTTKGQLKRIVGSARNALNAMKAANVNVYLYGGKVAAIVGNASVDDDEAVQLPGGASEPVAPISEAEVEKVIPGLDQIQPDESTDTTAVKPNATTVDVLRNPLSTLPDVTTNISPGDMTVAGPTKPQIQRTNTHTRIPAAALGVHVKSIRDAKITEVKESSIAEPSVSFVGSNDIKGDAKGGALSLPGQQVEKTALDHDSKQRVATDQSLARPTGGGFEPERVEVGGPSSKDTSEQPDGGKGVVVDDDAEPPASADNRTQRRHDASSNKRKRTATEQILDRLQRSKAFYADDVRMEPDFQRFNDASTGVQATGMLDWESNYLDRRMFDDRVPPGGFPMFKAFPPSPFVTARILGKF